MRLALLSKSWRDDPFRRMINARGPDADPFNFRVAARLILVHVMFHVLLKERMPGLALVYCVHVVLCECMAIFICRRREFYLKHREAIISLMQLQHTFTLMYGIVHGSSNPFDMHKGSALRLLFSQMAGAPIFMALYSMQARLLVSFNLWALPVVALVPLIQGRRVCERLLESPGVDAPLKQLFKWMDTIHVSRTPAPLMQLPTPAPLNICMAINTWSLLLHTVVVPLCVTYALERRMRRRFRVQAGEAAEEEAEDQGGAQEGDGGGGRAAAGAFAAPVGPTLTAGDLHPLRHLRVQPQGPTLPLTGAWPLDVYLASCCIWSVVTVAYQ